MHAARAMRAHGNLHVTIKMAECIFGLFVAPKKNTKSSAWLHFSLLATEDGRVIENEQDRPVCRACGKRVLAKASNTTNLFQHLREHHPMIYAELAPKKQPKRESSTSNTCQATLVSIVAKSAMYSPTSSQAKDLNRAITYHIAKDAMPLSTVEKPGFKSMVSKLNPRYQLPSRKHFSDYEIPRLYSEVRDNVVLPMLRQAKFYAATTDMWTSGANDAYITITVHFINHDWELHTCCLETVPMFSDHTGQNIADTVSAIFENWDLSIDKLVASTTDSGSNIVSAFRILNTVRISCFGHNLDLAIKKGLDSARVKSVIGRCHSLVELFHRSWKKCRDLRQKQQEPGLPQHKLMGDVATRWGSTFEMMARIIEQQQAISAVLAEDRKNWYRMPTDAEFSTLEVVVEVLKPLSYLTDALSGEKQVTASAVFPVMKHVKSKLSPADSDNQLATKMKQAMWNDLESRYTNPGVCEILDIASFLDPRFKDQHLQNKENTIMKITLECTENYGSIDEACTITERLSVEPETTESIETPPTKRFRGLAAVLKDIEQENEHEQSYSTNSLTPCQVINKEVASYLDFPAAESDTDPLTSWKSEKGRFPNLAHLARKYLCICGTSVPSERVFSTAGHIASRSRGRLLPQNVSKLLFLAKNIQ